MFEHSSVIVYLFLFKCFKQIKNENEMLNISIDETNQTYTQNYSYGIYSLFNNKHNSDLSRSE